MNEFISDGSTAVQTVTVVNGFAYGLVNADIHVFVNGLPLYLLANWRTEASSDPRSLREMPSRMLNARRAVVAFTGRESELAELRAWRESDLLWAARWLHGPGGQGKTRLAAQFAAESAAAGWKVVAAFHGPDADRAEPGSEDMSLGDAAGLLLIVDYADRWQLTNVTWLFKNRVLRAGRTRVLMLARSADMWPGIQAILDTHQAATSSMALAPLASSGGRRAEMFRVARDAFATVYSVTDATAIATPDSFSDPGFALILGIHVAALVAVDAAVRGVRPPTGQAALTTYLLDREQLHWARLYADGVAADDRVDGYLTSPSEMNRAVFTAILSGSQNSAQGVALFEAVGLSDPACAVRDHAVCYPSVNVGVTLEPLYPDRLAEDFLALTLPGHDTDYPAQSWALGVAATLLARDRDGKPSKVTTRALTFLAASAAEERWPHVRRYVDEILANDPALAVEAAGPALPLIARVASPAVLALIELELPEQQHVDLDLGALAITTQLTAHLMPTDLDPAERAGLLAMLSFRQNNARLYEKALESGQQAVALYEDLASNDTQTYSSALATALNSLANPLTQLGRYNEAHAAASRAAEIFLVETETAPEKARYLASALNNMSVLDRRIRARWDGTPARYSEDLPLAYRATSVYEKLARQDPDTFLPNYARARSNLGLRLMYYGRLDEALAELTAAVDTWRRLQSVDAGANLPDLVTSLRNLATLMHALGRLADVREPLHEAAGFLRTLAKTNPHGYLRDLAIVLEQYGDLLSRIGDHEASLAYSREAVDTWSLSARAGNAESGGSPTDDSTERAYPESGAAAAFKLGVRLAGSGDPVGAEAAYRLAIESGHRDLGPTSANNLGLLLVERGDLVGAEAAYRLAIDSEHPDKAPKAANNLGYVLEQRDDVAGAKSTYEFAIGSDHPDEAPAAANNLGALLTNHADAVGARAAYRIAIESGHPEEAPVAAIRLGLLLAGQGDKAGAMEAFRVAIDSGHPDLADIARAELACLT